MGGSETHILSIPFNLLSYGYPSAVSLSLSIYHIAKL